MPGDGEIIEVVFEVPKDVSEGLASGSLVRRGGVIQVASGSNKGHVVMWLREAAGLVDRREVTPPFNLLSLEAQVGALQSSV